jgi:hypothetical protein
MEAPPKSISDLTPEQRLINRLDDDFIYLLQFANNPMKNLSKRKQDLAKEWILKLSTSCDEQSITAKMKRNDYITKLLSCIQTATFSEPFNQSPPIRDLPHLEFDFSQIIHDFPEWINELRDREEKDIKVGGRGFETYFSSKFLENGACAYLAVSVQNEGDRSAWMKIVQNKINSDQIDKIFAKEFRDTTYTNNKQQEEDEQE